MRKCSNFGLIFKSCYMNKLFIAIMTSSFLMGCSTVYKTGQTPDDVYYSPSKSQEEYVILEDNEAYRPETVPMNDRYLRMKSMNRNRWSSFDDDYGYWNDPRWNNSMYFNNGSMYSGIGLQSLFYGSSSYYSNPYSCMYYGQPYVIYNNAGKGTLPSRRSTGPRVVNLNSYNPVHVSNYQSHPTNLSGRANGILINGRNSMMREGYNSNYNGNGNPSRTFSNSSNSSSSSSSNSSSSGSSSSSSRSSSAPVRSFPRGGGGL